jgi:acetyl-CoA carboxylase beta subunit
MVKYWIYYDDGNYELIKCPECKIEDISHVHTPGEYEDMICNQCATRFKLQERKEKIMKILSEEEMEEKDKIASSDAVERQKEYEDRAKRMRKENRE